MAQSSLRDPSKAAVQSERRALDYCGTCHDATFSLLNLSDEMLTTLSNGIQAWEGRTEVWSLYQILLSTGSMRFVFVSSKSTQLSLNNTFSGNGSRGPMGSEVRSFRCDVATLHA